MRHLLANVATYAIGAFLVLGAALFAWARSSQLVLTDERTMYEGLAATDAREFAWEQVGEVTYAGNCANCHGGGGEGWDQYPPITTAGAWLAVPGGREWLVDLHLYGLASDRWRAPMPPMGHLPDPALAAVLNHLLTRFGNERSLAPDTPLFMPADIAARRGQRLTPAAVNARRPGS